LKPGQTLIWLKAGGRNWQRLAAPLVIAQNDVSGMPILERKFLTRLGIT
jgi:hypothetical protein